MRFPLIALLLVLGLSAPCLAADADAERTAGIGADQDGKPEEAIAHFSKSIELAPNNDEGYAWRGLEEIKLRRYDDAIDDYTQAIAINPKEPAYYKSRGLAYARQGDPEHALADNGKAIDLAPDDASAYVNRANVYVALKNFDAAIADCNTVIDLVQKKGGKDGTDAEDLAVAYANRGIAYSALGRHDEALADLTEAIKRRSDAASSYVNRANVYINLARYDKAIADCNTAIKLVDEHRNTDGNDRHDLALAYANRGIAYSGAGKTKQSKADFAKARSINPTLRIDETTLPTRGNGVAR